MKRLLALFLAALLLVLFHGAARAALPRSSPEAQGIPSAAVLAFAKAADAKIDAIHSFMVVRHGHVVAEAWWAPYDAQTPHVLFSLSKSFTSTAVGFAVAEGKLNVDDPVLKFFPEDAPAEPSDNLRAMRVRDLLKMAVGHEADPMFWLNPNAPPGPAWTKRFLAHPVPKHPGEQFVYNTSATYMLSAIVQKVSGQTLTDYLGPRLFEPLGIENPVWDKSPEGIDQGGLGLSARTEDIASFGQFYLQRGRWNGQQLLPTKWVDEATTRQIETARAPDSDWGQGYGYQFWRGRHNSYRGDGAFGQMAIVLPDQDAVVAFTSGTGNLAGLPELIWNELLPAMEANALPEAPAEQEALRKVLAGLTLKMPTGDTSSPLAAEVSGKWFEFPPNNRGIQSVAIDFKATSPALLVRSAKGETRTVVGVGSWVKGRGIFANGMEEFLSVHADPLSAASGAWSAPNEFTVKVALIETPFSSTMKFRFEGGKLLFNSDYTVAFGPTSLPALEGTVATGGAGIKLTP